MSLPRQSRHKVTTTRCRRPGDDSDTEPEVSLSVYTVWCVRDRGLDLFVWRVSWCVVASMSLNYALHLIGGFYAICVLINKAIDFAKLSHTFLLVRRTRTHTHALTCLVLCTSIKG